MRGERLSINLQCLPQQITDRRKKNKIPIFDLKKVYVRAKYYLISNKELVVFRVFPRLRNNGSVY